MGSHLKVYLGELAREKLPARMGDRYAHVILSCLTCLDEDNDDFSDLADAGSDADIHVGVGSSKRYYCS
jgi:hypothetical protein